MRIAVFGATGEIGSRLVLALQEAGMDVRIIARGSLGPTLGRYRLEVVRPDFSDAEALAAALSGCPVVVNCSVEKRGSGDQDLIDKNERLARSIVHACQAAGAKRLVHLSSIVVQPPCLTNKLADNPQTFSEDSDWYTKAKIVSEKVVHEESGELETVVVRPGIVYGPTMNWSRIAFVRTKNHVMMLPEEKDTLCHAIHVDDLARLIVGLAKAKTVPSLVYGISREKLTWSDFYAGHAKAAGIDAAITTDASARIRSHVKVNLFMEKAERFVGKLLPTAFVDRLAQTRFFVSLRARVRNQASGTNAEVVHPISKAVVPRLVFWPTASELDLYCSTAVLSSEQVGEEYREEGGPVPFKQGCVEAAQWWQGQVERLQKEESGILASITKLSN